MIPLIDLFSGCGGMTLGFCDARFGGAFRSVFALDHDPAAAASYAHNFGPHGRQGDVEDWASGKEPVPPARVVIGGEITLCTDDVLSQIRSVVYQQAQPLATRNLSIVHTELGDEAGLIGGMVSAIEQVLSPRGIQYHTRPAGSDMKPLGKL